MLLLGFNVALARYNPDGSLDPTFGGDGRVVTDRGTQITDVAVLADGRIVAAGYRGSKFALARYNVDGSLDATFGNDGIVVTDFGRGDEARAMAIQADGKIVVAGETASSDGEEIDFALARYNADGTLDPTFGAGGLLTTDIAGSSDTGNVVAIQADGKIVVAGVVSGGEPTFRDFVIVRYEGPPPHPLTFFLQGNDLPGTTGVSTMTRTPPAPQVLRSLSKRRTCSARRS